MSKTSTYFLAAASLLSLLTGCADNGNEPATSAAKVCPGFTATIGDSSTRAFNQSWEQNDEIGINGAERVNVCYLTPGGNGYFNVKNQGEQIYFQDDKTEDFTAYYPWKELAEGAETVSADTRDQAKQKSFDFLWAEASGQKDAPEVRFSFVHKMTKVTFTVKPGDDMSFDEIKDARLSLGGFRHTGSFNIFDGSTETTDATETWSFSQYAEANEAEQTLNFSFIFFPQAFDNPLEFSAVLEKSGNDQLSLSAGIDFTSSNKGMVESSTGNAWVAGRQYNLSLTLHKTEISMGQSTINTWTPVTPGKDIDVD